MDRPGWGWGRVCPDRPVREPERKPSECAVLKGVHPLRKSLKAQITAVSGKTPHPANTTSSVEKGKICGGLGGSLNPWEEPEIILLQGSTVPRLPLYPELR